MFDNSALDPQLNYENIRLTVMQKQWIGEQMFVNKVSGSSLCRAYHLKKRRISVYGKMKSRGIIPKLNGGRPACLDEISIISLGKIDEINAESIKQEYANTFKRRFCVEVNEDDIPPISKKSIYRWLKRLTLV